MKNTKTIINIIIGALLVAGGVIYSLNALGITNLNISFNGWWTLFIIIPSIEGLITNKDKSASIAGLVIGVFLLLGARGIIDYDVVWKLMLPVIAIIIGIKIIVKSIKNENN